MNSPKSLDSSQASISYWGIVLMGLAGAAWLHLQAGLTLPLPVGDEVVFYYPALAFADAGSLQSPHLHANRALFWMPPGYMLLLAGWLKAIGVGLAQARWLSFGLAAAAYLLWANLFRRWGLGLSGLVLLSAAFLARHWVVMGNFVRMEGLELCLWALGLLSLERGKPDKINFAALSWFLLSLAVHPNGVYLCAWWVASEFRRLRSSSPTLRVDKGLFHLLPGLVAATAYGFYALLNWADFVHDWQHQLGTRQPGGFALLLFRPDQAAFLLLWAGCAWALNRNREMKGLWRPLGVAAVLWLVRMLGQGWSYGIFNILAVTVTAAVAVVLFQRLIYPKFASPFVKRWARAGTLTACIILALMAARVYSIPGLWGDYGWQGMWPQAGYKAPFFTEEDRSALRLHLDKAGRAFARAHNRPMRVYAIPEGEGILLGSRGGEGSSNPGAWLHVLPTFGSQLPDFVLWHRSGKGAFFASAEEDLKGIIDARLDTPIRIRECPPREPDERWYWADLRGRWPAFILPPNQSQNSTKNP